MLKKGSVIMIVEPEPGSYLSRPSRWTVISDEPDDSFVRTVREGARTDPYGGEFDSRDCMLFTRQWLRDQVDAGSVRIEKPLSPAQNRYLADIKRDGERQYNGRALRTLEILRERGLIEFDLDLRPHDYNRYTYVLTARPATEEER